MTLAGGWDQPATARRGQFEDEVDGAGAVELWLESGSASLAILVADVVALAGLLEAA